MRRFRTPENAGCGIAWVIGGELQTIQVTDDDWGFSVVSVGSDTDDAGDTYFCRDETLAHEIGHNLGQTHNIENSSSSGAHPYSYGYRETSSSGFYTIMSYPIPSTQQVAIPYFANPNVFYQGRTTGNASSADNVRSMQQTIPTIAQFRAQVVPLAGRARSDINNDGRSDILWTMGSQVAYWVMNGAAMQSSVYAGDATPGFTLMTTGDFNGDGAGDFVFSNGSTLRFLLNNGNGTGFLMSSAPAGGSWKPFSAVDMNGDGRSDLVWRFGSQVSYWQMNGSTIEQSVYAGDASPGFSAMCVADFNGDGKGDFVFSNGSLLRVWINNGNGTSFTSFTYAAGGEWKPFTAGDVNGDGKDDLIWRYGSQVSFWAMNGGTVLSSTYVGDATPGFRVVTLSDFSGDGAGDFVFSNGSTLKIWINNGNGTGFTQTQRDAGGAWTLFDPNIVE
jgi:peptidyl-Asp metalloendopeptidase